LDNREEDRDVRRVNWTSVRKSAIFLEQVGFASGR
jgi:hypothetical protein